MAPIRNGVSTEPEPAQRENDDDAAPTIHRYCFGASGCRRGRTATLGGGASLAATRRRCARRLRSRIAPRSRASRALDRIGIRIDGDAGGRSVLIGGGE